IRLAPTSANPGLGVFAAKRVGNNATNLSPRTPNRGGQSIARGQVAEDGFREVLTLLGRQAARFNEKLLQGHRSPIGSTRSETVCRGQALYERLAADLRTTCIVATGNSGSNCGYSV